jgi:hypothetical protein
VFWNKKNKGPKHYSQTLLGHPMLYNIPFKERTYNILLKRPIQYTIQKESKTILNSKK